jgi:hypothetical protein
VLANSPLFIALARMAGSYDALAMTTHWRCTGNLHHAQKFQNSLATPHLQRRQLCRLPSSFHGFFTLVRHHGQ